MPPSPVSSYFVPRIATFICILLSNNSIYVIRLVLETKIHIHADSSGLRCGTAAVRLLRLWVRIPSGTWMSVSCECCVLAG